VRQNNLINSLFLCIYEENVILKEKGLSGVFDKKEGNLNNEISTEPRTLTLKNALLARSKDFFMPK
jgi:hypothetical protein